MGKIYSKERFFPTLLGIGKNKGRYIMKSRRFSDSSKHILKISSSQLNILFLLPTTKFKQLPSIFIKKRVVFTTNAKKPMKV